MKFDYWLFLKGMLMGAADIVPGVSGGTIAFITGIYERLINAITSIVPELLSLFGHRDLKTFWVKIDGLFLVTLLAGIVSSLILFANLISYLLDHHPIPLWAFFFGLIVASVWIVIRQVKCWRYIEVLSLVVGVVFAWVLTSITPAEMEITYLNIFLAGCLAICAMILPGISGSFILLLLGAYSFIILSIKQMDLLVILVFASGCAFGLLSIANFLSWALSRFHDLTLALLTGFMIGALNKVWPWKEVLEYMENRHGEMVPYIEKNVSPFEYELLTGAASQLSLSILSSVIACFLVVFIDRYVARGDK